MTDTPKALVAGQAALAMALASIKRAADSILWMAEKYAEGGGAHGPEMEDYRKAATVIESMPVTQGVRLLERLRLAEAVCEAWGSSPYPVVHADTQSAYIRWKRFMDQEDGGETA